MNGNHIVDLIAEIDDETRRLSQLAANIHESRGRHSQSETDKRIQEQSLALELHNFYTGCEKIFTKIASDINGGIPRSFDWHKRLLHTMSLEIEDIRPPVISEKTEALLSEFLGFRHVVRNAYGFNLDSQKLEVLLNRFDDALELFVRDISAFRQFLKNLSR